MWKQGCVVVRLTSPKVDHAGDVTSTLWHRRRTRDRQLTAARATLVGLICSGDLLSLRPATDLAILVTRTERVTLHYKSPIAAAGTVLPSGQAPTARPRTLPRLCGPRSCLVLRHSPALTPSTQSSLPAPSPTRHRRPSASHRPVRPSIGPPIPSPSLHRPAQPPTGSRSAPAQPQPGPSSASAGHSSHQLATA